MMSEAELGKLEQVDVRRAWRHEAYNFTPWLAENLDRLAAEVGIELELEGTELKVGPYQADIVARFPRDDSRVLIENQLEEANLQHLGQVLAYLAGLEARIVIWVATDFNHAHLSAIRWLNEHTADPFAFFAVRVAVVRIGDSSLAPVFEVLERPNEWDRRVQDASQRVPVREYPIWTDVGSRGSWSARTEPVTDRESVADSLEVTTPETLLVVEASRYMGSIGR